MLKRTTRAQVIGIMLAAAATLLLPSLTQAQTYPDRPVTIVVPFPPGGATDIIARLLAQHLSEVTKQPFVVSNVAGASGSIGHERVARAPADGYTLIVGTASTIAGNPAYNQTTFDPIKDFTPIAMLTTESMALIVHPSVPANTVAELITLARAKPGALTMASFGYGSISHLAGELFKMNAGIDMLHVPYQGSGPAVTALIGGQVLVMIHTLSVSLPGVQSGKLRLLAITDTARKSVLPNIPTVSEAGVPGYSAITWLGLFGPARLPKEIVAFLSGESAKMLAKPEVRERLTKMGSEPSSGTPGDLADNLKRDFEKWKKTIKDGGIKRE